MAELPAHVAANVLTRLNRLRMPALIATKRDGGELSDEALEAFVAGVAAGVVPAEQIGAMLMAIYLRGLSARETSVLTQAMRYSGEVRLHGNRTRKKRRRRRKRRRRGKEERKERSEGEKMRDRAEQSTRKHHRRERNSFSNPGPCPRGWLSLEQLLSHVPISFFCIIILVLLFLLLSLRLRCWGLRAYRVFLPRCCNGQRTTGWWWTSTRLAAWATRSACPSCRRSWRTGSRSP